MQTVRVGVQKLSRVGEGISDVHLAVLFWPHFHRVKSECFSIINFGAIVKLTNNKQAPITPPVLLSLT